MKIEMVIPAKDNDGPGNTAVIDAAVRPVCGVFGGATVHAARGYWLNDAGRLFVDEVAVVSSSATGQEAVFLPIGGKTGIIE